jgi:hypothetical protein
MAIDDTRKWWTGTEAADLPVYVAELTKYQHAYPATEFRAVRCGCGSDEFQLLRSREMTQRTCAGCGEVRFVSRGKVALAAWQESIHEEKPEPFRCVGCKGRRANICVGFAGYPEAPHLPKDSVKWFYVGIRCCTCGILRVYNNGKVGRVGVEVYAEVIGDADTPASKPKNAKKPNRKPKRRPS